MTKIARRNWNFNCELIDLRKKSLYICAKRKKIKNFQTIFLSFISYYYSYDVFNKINIDNQFFSILIEINIYRYL